METRRKVRPALHQLGRTDYIKIAKVIIVLYNTRGTMESHEISSAILNDVV